MKRKSGRIMQRMSVVTFIFMCSFYTIFCTKTKIRHQSPQQKSTEIRNKIQADMIHE